jgi:hypothetical protein
LLNCHFLLAENRSLLVPQMEAQDTTISNLQL